MTGTLGSVSILHRSDAKVSDRCMIDVGLDVFAIWVSIHSELLVAVFTSP